MGSADYLDLKAEIIGGLPPGTEYFLDYADPEGPGPLYEAIGHVLEDCGTAQVDALRLELSPLTCSAAGLAIWERTLGLQNSRIARFGTSERRRAQVLARLREYGPPNKRLVQMVVNAFFVYADQTQMVLLESNRSALRDKNQKLWTGPANFGPGVTATLTWTVWDDPRVSKGGAQVDLNITCSDLRTLQVTLTAPGPKVYTWPQPIGEGSRAAGPGGVNLRLYAPSFVGHETIFGTWTMTLTSNNPGDSVISGILLVEALGRYFDWMGKPCDGLGAAMYEWAALADAALLGSDYDLDAALLAVRRLSYARSKASIVRKTMAGLIAIPDDPWTIPDQVVPG